MTVSSRVEIQPEHGATLVGSVVAAQTATAPTWLFLHGFGSDRSGAKATAILEHAAHRGHGAVAIDQRFHGESSGDPTAIRLTTMVEDAVFVLQAICNGLGGAPDGPTLVVGSSLGGLVASAAAARNPGLVSALTLIAPAFGWFKRMLDRPRDGEGRVVIQNEWIDLRVDAELVAAEAAHLDEPSILAALTPPVSIVHGSDDDTVPLDTSRRAVAAIPDPCDLVVVEGGDHRLTDHIQLVIDRTEQLAGL